MANPVNGRVTLSADIKTTSESAWKKATTELEKAVKAALEGITVSGVTIDAAGLGLVQEIGIIESDDNADDGDEKSTEDESSEDESNDEADEKPKKEKKNKGAKEGKKKGRK